MWALKIGEHGFFGPDDAGIGIRVRITEAFDRAGATADDAVKRRTSHVAAFLNGMA